MFRNRSTSKMKTLELYYTYLNGVISQKYTRAIVRYLYNGKEFSIKCNL